MLPLATGFVLDQVCFSSTDRFVGIRFHSFDRAEAVVDPVNALPHYEPRLPLG